MNKKQAVERLVDSFSQVPANWVATMAEKTGDSFFDPMWSTMWIVKDSVDARNILKLQVTDNEDENSETYGFQQLKDLGIYSFMIDGEIVLGINGAGYDFWESHWTPLYDALGYNWHDKEENND